MAKRDYEDVDLKPAMAQINAALKSSDIALFCKAMGDAIMLHNVADIARKAGVERPTVYRAFGDTRSFPNFSTVLGVLDAMGLQLKVVKSRKRRSTTLRFDRGDGSSNP
jgi:probable addiction module antidote protein